MPSRRVATTLAIAALAALGACSREVGNNAQAKPGVGARIDGAIERTQEKLSTAGEKAKEDVQQATEKTQEALSRAGDRISATTTRATQAPPAATTTTLGTGPNTRVTITPAQNPPRPANNR